jgi:hypothetical protein
LRGCRDRVDVVVPPRFERVGLRDDASALGRSTARGGVGGHAHLEVRIASEPEHVGIHLVVAGERGELA